MRYNGTSGNYLGAGGRQNVRQIPGTQYTEDFYTYTVAIASINAAATNIQQLTIQADSDFEWVMTTVAANVAAEDEPFTDALIIPVAVLITDSGSGRQLMSQAVPISSIGGTGKQPFINPIPRIFKAKSTVTLAFSNYSTSVYDNLYFNLIGRKIFDISN